MSPEQDMSMSKPRLQFILDTDTCIYLLNDVTPSREESAKLEFGASLSQLSPLGISSSGLITPRGERIIFEGLKSLPRHLAPKSCR